MTINLTVLRTTSGWPLTPSGIFVQEPWNDSPRHPAALETAPSIAVSRVDGGTVNLVWSPDSYQADRADVRIRLQLRGSVQVSYFLVDWGDGGSPEVIDGMDLPNLTLQLEHLYLAASTLIQVSAYDAGSILVDSNSVAVSIVRSSDYLIHQYRIERFKGKVNYQIHNKRWYQDWVEYTGSAFETNVNDYDAPNGWNWGYRLWLREVDDQDRPNLIMNLSAWVETGTGEGS